MLQEVDGSSKKRRRLGKRYLMTAEPNILWQGCKELNVYFMNSDKNFMLDGRNYKESEFTGTL